MPFLTFFVKCSSYEQRFWRYVVIFEPCLYLSFLKETCFRKWRLSFCNVLLWNALQCWNAPEESRIQRERTSAKAVGTWESKEGEVLNNWRRKNYARGTLEVWVPRKGESWFGSWAQVEGRERKRKVKLVICFQ